MMKHGFAAESAHIENLDPEFEGMPILRERHDGELTTSCPTASASAAPTAR